MRLGVLHYFSSPMDHFFKENLVLGSGSPRRKEILTLAGISYTVKVSDVDESFSEEDKIEDIPEMLALRKARAIQQQFHLLDQPILTADTIVALGQKVLGKPKDRADAIEILSAISGKEHQVITGVAYVLGDFQYTFSDVTKVSFEEMSLEEIEYYVDEYRPYDKAGAYAIQEWIGVRFIQKIEGCYYNVMGLPMPKIRKIFSW